MARQTRRQRRRQTAPLISVRASDFASVCVGVSGAVVAPHAEEIGGVRGDTVYSQRQTASVAPTEGRDLSAALRPDADTSAVEVRRGSKTYRLDMRGVFEGQNTVDIMLLTGDEVRVPSRQCFQDDLMRPSPISPPGVSLFLSNLTFHVKNAMAKTTIETATTRIAWPVFAGASRMIATSTLAVWGVHQGYWTTSSLSRCRMLRE